MSPGDPEHYICNSIQSYHTWIGKVYILKLAGESSMQFGTCSLASYIVCRLHCS